MPPPDVPQHVYENPLVIYAFIALMLATIAVLFSKKLQELLGPVGRWIGSRQVRQLERKRQELEAQGHLDDLRFDQQEQRIAFLERELAEERAEKAQYADQARELSRQLADVQRQLDALKDEVAATRRAVEGRGEVGR